MTNENSRMKPMLIIKTGTMSKEDVKTLNENGICTVESKEPSMVKFLDPIPSAAERTRVEQAALALSRKLLDRDTYSAGYGSQKELGRSDVAKLFVDMVVKGTAIDPTPTQSEREKEIFDNAKAEELRRLAREEAKAERAAKKAADKKKEPEPTAKK